MVKRRRETDSDGASESRTVFVDTSLDTHLALIVSNSDTVTDFKKKIVLEHMQCFPEIGNIQIHSLKVKRRDNFYHLPDIILVWSALHGIKGSWFLSADASGAPACRLSQITSELGTSNGERMDLMTVDDDGLLSDKKKISTLSMSLPNGVSEKNVVMGGLTIDKSFEKTTDFQTINYSDENVTEFEPPAKKKRKVNHKEDIRHNTNLKDSNASVHASSQDISRPKTSSVDALTEGQVGMIRNEQQGKPTISDVRNDECNNRDTVVFEVTSVPAPEEKSNLESIGNSQKLLVSDKSKEDGVLESMIPENITVSKPESELAQNVATDHQGGDAVKIPNISAMLMDASDAMGDVNSDVKKMRKKKKTKKTPARIQDDMEQIIKGEDVNVGAETHKSEEQEGEKEVHLNHDQGGDAIKVPNISAMLMDACDAVEDVNSDSKKKRKRKIKKTPEKIQDTSYMEQIIEGEDVNVGAETHKSEEQDGEKEVTLNHDHELIVDANVDMGREITSGTEKKKKRKEKKSSQTKLEKSGIEQADNGASGATGLLPSTDHNPEETDKRQSILNNKGNNVHMKLLDSSSTDACEKVQDANENAADFVALTQNEQTVEKENQIVELNQEEKNKDKKTKKKSKKSKRTASDILEKLPITDQKLGLEVLAIVENLNSLVESEHERVSKEMLEEMNVTALNNDDLAKPVENKGDGINFKHYFVAEQDQDRVGSGEKVKKATKSNAEMKTRKKVKGNGLPSVSISTELQSSINSVGNQETESKSRVGKASGVRNGESKQNSDQGEVNPNSIKGSLPVPRNGVEDSNPNDRSLDKSSLEKSESLLKNGGNKKSMWSLNVNSMTAVKTPLKRSLLSKAGGLFEDNSSESSSDENGNLHFDATIHTPSDSSSDTDSGDSVGGSDSTGNESNDAKGRSAGGKSTSKLDLSASKDLTMDMTLRSSKRFKKTKLIVSSKNELEQNESQEPEFVPDSLANP